MAGFNVVSRGGGARVPQNVATFPGAGQTITTITETKTITDGVPDTVAAFPGLYISIMVVKRHAIQMCNCQLYFVEKEIYSMTFDIGFVLNQHA